MKQKKEDYREYMKQPKRDAIELQMNRDIFTKGEPVRLVCKECKIEIILIETEEYKRPVNCPLGHKLSV